MRIDGRKSRLRPPSAGITPHVRRLEGVAVPRAKDESATARDTARAMSQEDVQPMAEIRGIERLTHIFGRWPSFHDAEVLRVRLDHDAQLGAALETDIHLFEMTSEVDERGYYVLRNHTLATLRFDGMSALDLGWFDRQNVIADLSIKEIAEPEEATQVWHVELASSVGMEASFDCATITVAEARPFGLPDQDAHADS
jgi:hypothetical protein